MDDHRVDFWLILALSFAYLAQLNFNIQSLEYLKYLKLKLIELISSGNEKIILEVQNLIVLA